LPPKPAKGAAHQETTFHTCLVRATDHAREGLDTFSRHDYSRRQAFNADNTLFLTNTRDGGWFLYDARTLEKKQALHGLAGDAEPQWHPSDPGVLYYGFRNGGMQIMSLDVRSNDSRVVADLKGKLPWRTAARAWTRSEGSPSRDGRYWGLQVETESFEILGLAVWDMRDGKLIGSVPVRSRPDHVSMSPSGRWFVSSGGDGTMVWARDLGRKRLLHKTTEHSDLVIGPEGHDYYVSIDYQSNEGYIFMVDLDTGGRTDLIRTYLDGAATAVHFSGKAYDKPGWVLASTYNGAGPFQWYMDNVFAMELRANPRIYQLALHHSAVKDAYFAEPQATVNRDFTRVLFNSNWGVAASNDVDTYMIRLPAGAFP
jgi:WD40 repeat protein